ncbi:hypothetical protein OSK54_19810, partial [Escherichia coli]|nr:hypothetical protein [Escherichia coli]
DRNRSHWSTSKTPSYTKSVSWQHHPELDGMNLTENAARLTPHDKLPKEYLYQCLRSNFCQNQFTDKTLQVGVQKMALNRLSNTLIPLAPSMEAAKIIDNIKKLKI